jgi:hypothetical protein
MSNKKKKKRSSSSSLANFLSLSRSVDLFISILSTLFFFNKI